MLPRTALAHAAQVAVAACAIVEAIDVLGHVVSRQLSIFVDLLLDPFLFQAGEEGEGCKKILTLLARTHERHRRGGHDARCGRH